jgi:hypothetical protein
MEPPLDYSESDTDSKDQSWPRYQPDDEAFGGVSCVKVPIPEELLEPRQTEDIDQLPTTKDLSRTRIKRIAQKREDPISKTKRIPVNQRWSYELVPQLAVDVGSADQHVDGFSRYHDKYEAAVAIQPRNEVPGDLGILRELGCEDMDDIPDNEHGACYLHGTIFLEEELGWCRIYGWGVECGSTIVYYAPVMTSESRTDEHHASLAEVLSWIKNSPRPPKSNKYRSSRTLVRPLGSDRGGKVMRILSCKQMRIQYGTMNHRQGPRPIHATRLLAIKTIRKILKMQESLFKYGTYVPRNDKEASASPEANRWKSGKQLEWLRLHAAKTFESDWTWEKMKIKFPEYKKEDIGTMFYIYDYKFSGEHRVRLVFNGAKQSPSTYTDTYAPTVRAESVRLFHIYSVEYSFSIQQYDVPQAFLRSDADCDIFVYPPRGNVEFPGQILKLSKMLYGSKQAAALWFNLLDTFLKKLGFVSSYFDPCFYRRPISCNENDPDLAQCDAIIILHVDDMRVAATPDVLKDIHDKLFTEFQITTSDTGRFLGMDTAYDLKTGIMKMHMATYIEASVQRFRDFDVTNGAPFRELVGSLLWIVLNIIGPELLRVKDLARRSNDFTVSDYEDALKVLMRISERRDYGIVYRRGGAGREYVPASSRLEGGLKIEQEYVSPCRPGEYDPVLEGFPYALHTTTASSEYSIGDAALFNELDEKNLYKVDPLMDDITMDILKVLAPTNKRFTKVAYSDASFAVGETKQSISGFIIMINGTPLLFGSLKQTVVVDSTCSAEYVAASICCKQILEIENMVQFLGFTCPRPYKMYTDSQACLKIATSNTTLGKVRHLEIRYHLVRCVILSGNIKMEFCITEEMLADLFTKIVTSSQDNRLAVRFYNDCVVFEENGSK